MTHVYKYSDTFRVDSSMSFKNKGIDLGVNVNKDFKEQEISATVSFGGSIPDGIQMPSLNLQFASMKPYGLHVGGSYGNLNFGVEKEIPKDGSSSYGYELDVGLATENITLNPKLFYKIEKNVLFNTNLVLDLAGAIQ